MQGKGLIKFFLVALVAITFYQLFLMLPTRKVEKRAAEQATKVAGENNPDNPVWKAEEVRYLDSMSSETVLNLGFVKMNYQDLKSKQLALGLDLKGGMSVVMQVDLSEFLKALSDDSKNEKFLTAIRQARDQESNAQDDFITLFYNEWKKVSEGENLASVFAFNQALKDRINFDSSDPDVLKVINEEADAVVNNVFNLISQRIDRYGVIQPTVTLDDNTNRILVELPGVSNPKAAQNYLTGLAELGFYEMYTGQEINGALELLDQRLKSTEDKPDFLVDVDSAQMEFDSLGFRVDSFYQANREQLEAQATNPAAATAGPLKTKLTLSLGGQGGAGVCGFSSVSDTALINEFLNSKAAKQVLPPDAVFVWDAKPIKDEKGNFTREVELYTIKMPRSGLAQLTGDAVTDAKSDIDPQTSEYIINLAMDSQGASTWRKMTGRNVNRPVGIILDKQMISAPNVQEEIAGGNTRISGSFTAQEATDIANILEVGSLPARPEIISQDIVGPSLGAQNIRNGFLSLVIGVCLVLAFMILYYGTGGFISILALLANLFFIVGALASFGTVLTMPGVAGIVLTIGMAVDANVIIYERIREELRDGKAMLAAIRDGFANSYSAIIDANVTTILTALVLSYFGQGPIKGFAVVLIIGVLCSLFTAVLCARLMIDWWTDKGRDVSFFSKIFGDAFANLNIDFVSKGRMSMIISGIFILLGVGSFFTRGFELGVDLKGGSTYTLAFEDAVDPDAVRPIMEEVFQGEGVIVKSFGASNQVQVTTSYLINDRDEDADDRRMTALYNGVSQFLGQDALQQSEDNEAEYTNAIDAFTAKYVKSSVKVGPTIADDIRQSSIYATIVALLFIFVYILLRFNAWQYGAGAVAALFHDVLVVLSFFSLLHSFLPFSLEINQAFIAALLTVVGYSINDTVVVFDRIREFFTTFANNSKEENVNLAINNTVSRTVITSLTTIFVVLMLFIFGGESIRGFAFALLIGIIVGTYSSIFIATPTVVFLSKDDDLKVTRTAGKGEKSKGYKRKVTNA